MKLGLYINDSSYLGLDMANPYLGNPGVGGTQFCFLMLIYSLLKYSDYEITVFVNYEGSKYPQGAKVVKVDGIEDALQKAKAADIDFFLMKTVSASDTFDIIEKVGQKVVFWSHNYILADAANRIANSKNIVANVFVGKQQYDRYIDHPLIEKSTFIFNMICDSLEDVKIDVDSKIVCYMGVLIPSKGFHLLAKIWKDVLREVPEASLYVIGTGQVYSRDAKLGALGVADEEYERRFFPYLSENGKLLESVKFLGLLGREKSDVFAKSAVGVVNPTARTEIFSISIMEMAISQLPVVTLNKNGFPDSIKNEVTGILANSECGIKSGIVTLLKNPQKRAQMGKEAKLFVKNFAPEKITPQWIDLFENLKNGTRKLGYCKPSKPYANNCKFLRIANRFLRFGLKLKFLPPLISVETFALEVLKKIGAHR